MTNRNTRISRKELYSGSMIIFIALFHLLTASIGLFQLRKELVELPFQEVKMLLLALFYLTGGLLFIRGKITGWIFASGILLHFVMVIAINIFSLASLGVFNSYAGMVVLLFFLLLLSLIFLFNRDTRKKYTVNNKNYILAIGIYIILMLVNFRL